MNLKQRLSRIEDAILRSRQGRNILRVLWPDGTLTGPLPSDGDHVTVLRVVYDGNGKAAIEHPAEA